MTPEAIILQARRIYQLTEQMERPTPVVAILVSQGDMDRLVEWSNALVYRDAEPLVPGEVKKMWVSGVRVIVDEDL